MGYKDFIHLDISTVITFKAWANCFFFFLQFHKELNEWTLPNLQFCKRIRNKLHPLLQRERERALQCFPLWLERPAQWAVVSSPFVLLEDANVYICVYRYVHTPILKHAKCNANQTKVPATACKRKTTLRKWTLKLEGKEKLLEEVSIFMSLP